MDFSSYVFCFFDLRQDAPLTKSASGIPSSLSNLLRCAILMCDSPLFPKNWWFLLNFTFYNFGIREKMQEIFYGDELISNICISSQLF